MIGGSSIGAIVGVDKYKNKFDVWRRIVEGHETPSGIAARLGNALEPLARELYVESTGLKLLGPQTFTRPEYPFAVGHLDDVAKQGNGWRRVVELKTSSIRLARNWGDGDEIPQSYLCQVQWYMRLADMPRADVAVLLGNEEFKVYDIPADTELQNMLFDAAAKFWRDHIVTKKPPAIDGSDSCTDFLKSKYPAETLPMLPLDESLLRAVQEWREAKDVLAGAESAEAAAKNKLVALLGNASGVEGGTFRLTYRAQAKTTTKWTEVAKEAGIPQELIAKHTHAGAPFRVLRFTEKKS